MGRLAGYGGAFVVATITTTAIKSWSIDYTVDVLETTAFDSSGIKAYIPGLKGWNGNADGYKDSASTPVAIGTEVALQLKESAAAGQLWSGQGILTSIGVASAVDGVVTYAYGFQGTGALTVATA